jgi:hypothetical protein
VHSACEAEKRNAKDGVDEPHRLILALHEAIMKMKPQMQFVPQMSHAIDFSRQYFMRSMH